MGPLVWLHMEASKWQHHATCVAGLRRSHRSPCPRARITPRPSEPVVPSGCRGSRASEAPAPRKATDSGQPSQICSRSPPTRARHGQDDAFMPTGGQCRTRGSVNLDGLVGQEPSVEVRRDSANIETSRQDPLTGLAECQPAAGLLNACNQATGAAAPARLTSDRRVTGGWRLPAGLADSGPPVPPSPPSRPPQVGPGPLALRDWTGIRGRRVDN
jgi:hypothetical protein